MYVYIDNYMYVYTDNYKIKHNCVVNIFSNIQG